MSAPVTIAFAGEVIEWRGPAPFYFVAVPESQVGEVHWAARTASYGWGCVSVKAEVAGVPFTTSLIPRDGGYLLPLKVAVRRKAGFGLGERIKVTMTIGGA